MPPGVIIDVLDLSPLLQYPPEVDTQHLLIGEREVHKGAEALVLPNPLHVSPVVGVVAHPITSAISGLVSTPFVQVSPEFALIAEYDP